MSLVSCVFPFVVISLVSGASRYVVSTLTEPLSGANPPNQAYPIDVCVNYEVGLSGLTPVLYWGVFTCNADGDEVTLTSYGQDSTCTTVDTGIDATVFAYSAGVTAGEYGSFNCVGENDYVVTDGCQVNTGQGDANTTCCSDDCIPNAQAINVCVQKSSGVYTKVSCDEDTGTTFTNFYTAAGCDDSNLDASSRLEWDIDLCEFYNTVIIKDVWLRMHGCYIGGVADTSSMLCGETTMDTTEISNMGDTSTTSGGSDDESNAITLNVPFFAIVVMMGFMLRYF